MFLLKISNHKQLQRLTQQLTESFQHRDPFVLRGAILEVLQNTLQHSDGRFGLLLTDKAIVVASLPKNSGHLKYNLGMKMYGGIHTSTRGELFITRIETTQVQLKGLNIEHTLQSCKFEF